MPLINDTQFLYHLRVTIMWPAFRSQLPQLPAPNSQVTSGQFSNLHSPFPFPFPPRDFFGACALHRSAFFKLPARAWAIIYYAGNLIHVTYLLLNAARRIEISSAYEYESQYESQYESRRIRARNRGQLDQLTTDGDESPLAERER